ncbi:short chain dehydrogenase/reductase [Xylaria bambusicola]|uniref:short chain dehydrogenase/reductase n=1 Tax=Xylaria bambusicola TaxID=326684 RepID=UPI002008082C|nr:short chain dehydrogenase/reductase [Xylaria bambusicola]KAI0528239.1 short chain dehydrogenase/reductase [Xylaria bambusicola]
MNSFNTITSAIGTSLLLYTSYKLLNTARLYLRPSGLHRYRYTDVTGQRPWALVTGSSSGIGKNLAFELAEHGFNIVLHGRNPSKLETVRDELHLAHPDTKVRIIVADASQCHRPDAVDFAHIRDEVASLHLTVLINCAGAGPNPAFGGLEKYGPHTIIDSLHLNAVFPTLLTATLLPVLRGQYRDGKPTSNAPTRPRPALIINIGSVTDDGFPLVSFYSAGKSAVHTLHKAIAREAALDGWDADVEIISHRVGAVTGVSHTQAAPSLLRPDARTIAKAILARTGCGRKSVVPYWPHAVLQVVLAILPVWLVDTIINGAMREERRVQDETAKNE